MSTTTILVDTCVVSYVMKGVELGKAYTKHIEGKLPAISFVTVGELYYGAELAGWREEQRQQLEDNIRKYVVLPYTKTISIAYGKIVAERKHAGRPIGMNDAWIAACALGYEVPLLTHNSKDFSGITGLTVITEQLGEES